MVWPRNEINRTEKMITKKNSLITAFEKERGLNPLLHVFYFYSTVEIKLVNLSSIQMLQYKFNQYYLYR